MSDRLYLSCWVRGFQQANMLRHFEKLLAVFPFSKLSKIGPVLRVYGMDHTEPPVTEREFLAGTEPPVIVGAAKDFALVDCSAEVDGYWDLWQYDGDWKLLPAAVTLVCAGPEFENETGDQLRIEFGVDSRFLPQKGLEGSARLAQSNLRSLLHLVSEVEQELPLERRVLWSESGANFADIVSDTLNRFEVN